MYVLVENMRRFLRKFPRGNKLRHFGQWLPDKNMISGGPGYTLNAAALRRFVEEALPHCAATQKVSHEDRLVSKCLALIGILGNETDTRDVDSGEQQYHDANPSQLYTFRANQGRSYQSKIASHWEILPHPSRPNETVGSKHELDAAATYSVTFHNLFNPQYVARVHAILYRMCPLDSPLGIGMQQRHSIV